MDEAKIRQIKNEIDSGMDHDPQAVLTNLHLWMRALVDALLSHDGAIATPIPDQPWHADLYRNPDHRVWAAKFCSIAVQKGFDPNDADDIDWVGTWFANAMMHGHDRALGRFPTILPDGSAFAIGEA